jgi:outer membrane lipoprotein-sorting protein
MRRFSVLAAALCVLPATAQDRPARWLQYAIESFPRQRFSGTRVTEVIVGDRRQSVVEYVWRDGFNSRIEYPENSFRRGWIVVERRDVRLEYDPHRNEIRRSPINRDPAAGGQFLERVRLAFRNGQLKLSEFDGGEVAGRRSTGLTISDVNGNIAQRFWIDVERGNVLRVVQYGRGGEERGRFEFQRLNYQPDINPDLFQINRQGAKIVDEPAAEVPWRPLLPTWLPDGFREAGRNTRQSPGGPVLMLHYTNGSQHISVFQGRGKKEDILPPRGRENHLNLLSARVGDLWVAVLGDVPTPALERVLKSLR